MKGKNSYFRIYEHDHFYRQYEDVRNNLFMLILNQDLEDWLEENMKGRYDVNCDDYYDTRGRSAHMIIEFTDEADAMAFRLRWL